VVKLKIDSLVYFIKIIFFHLFLRKYTMYMVLMKLGSDDWHKLLQSYHKHNTRKILSYIRIILFRLVFCAWLHQHFTCPNRNPPTFWFFCPGLALAHMCVQEIYVFARLHTHTGIHSYLTTLKVAPFLVSFLPFCALLDVCWIICSSKTRECERAISGGALLSLPFA